MFSFLVRMPDTANADGLFSEAYACLEQGLCYDEVDDYENTLGMYERGLNLIKEAEKEKNAKKSELYKNLMEAKVSVSNRIAMMKKDGPRPKPSSSLESGEKKLLQEDSSVTSRDVEMKIKSSLRDQLDNVGDAEADLIFFIPEGVQLFTVNGDATTAPTYPTSLQIFRFSADSASMAYEMNDPGAFIQVGPWVYPLMKGKTPVLRNDYGAFLVPNPTEEHPNMAVAILLPSDLESRVRDEFLQVLNEYAVVRDQDVTKELTPEENKRMSRKIAEYLIASGDRIAWGVQTVTVKMASRVDERGEKFRSDKMATETPANINPALKGSVVVLHKGSKVVAKCTRYLLDKIGDMGVSIGRSVASSAQRNFGDGKGGGLVSGTIEILGGGIAGAGTVWMSLEDGSKSLCRSIANQTVENVKVRYGDEASETTHHALFAAGHSSLAAMQLWDLGPRSVAGRVARKAGIQVVQDLHESRRGLEYRVVDEKKVAK